jgi:hypothetical protein
MFRGLCVLHIHVCMWMCLYICRIFRECALFVIWTHGHIRQGLYMRSYAYAYIGAYISTYVYIYMCVCIYIYINTYLHTYTHVYIYTHVLSMQSHLKDYKTFAYIYIYTCTQHATSLERLQNIGIYIYIHTHIYMYSACKVTWKITRFKWRTRNENDNVIVSCWRDSIYWSKIDLYVTPEKYLSIYAYITHIYTHIHHTHNMWI